MDEWTIKEMNADELCTRMEEHGIQVDITNYGSSTAGVRVQYEAIVGSWQCHWREVRRVSEPARLVRNGAKMQCSSYMQALEYMIYQTNIKRVTCWMGHTYTLHGNNGVYDGTCPKCREYTRRYDNGRK